MKVSRLLSALMLTFSFSVLSPARADWEADFTASASKGEFPKTKGKFYSKMDRFRVDSPYPFELSAYVKAGSRHSYVAVHSFKIRLSSNLEKFSGELPACLSADFSLCIKELKLKKVANEKCGEKTCDVFEGTVPKSGLKKVKLWHWSGEKEPILAKCVLTKKNGSEITTTFSNISRKSRETSFYTVPGNYKDAGSLESFYGDLKGQDE